MTTCYGYTMDIYGIDGYLRSEEFDTLEGADRQAEYLFNRFGYECHISAEIATVYGYTVHVIPWDGFPVNGGPRYKGDYSKYMMDDDGNVYYERNDGSGLWAFWCSAHRLAAHIRDVNRICGY